VPPGQKTQITTAKAIKRRVKVDETIVLAELAKRMGIKANEMIVKLMGMGVMATVNQTIDLTRRFWWPVNSTMRLKKPISRKR
jgi:translation initiation factor IF-2